MYFYKINNEIIPSEKKMDTEELTPNTTDGAYEKHVPVIEQQGDHVTVRVGSVAHPMLDEHYSVFIALETEKGVQVKWLNPGEAPAAEFTLVDDKPLTVYEYCNLHGLWKADI